MRTRMRTRKMVRWDKLLERKTETRVMLLVLLVSARVSGSSQDSQNDQNLIDSVSWLAVLETGQRHELTRRCKGVMEQYKPGGEAAGDARNGREKGRCRTVQNRHKETGRRNGGRKGIQTGKMECARIRNEASKTHLQLQTSQLSPLQASVLVDSPRRTECNIQVQALLYAHE